MDNESFKPTRWTFLFLMLASAMIFMGAAAVAPALPLISKGFPDASEATISLIITLPALAIALTGFFMGVLSDKIGRIPVLVASLAIFSLAGSSAFYLSSLPEILVGRFILGIGIAGITCSTTALIIDYYHGETRMRVLGYQAAAMGVGVLLLETSGGYLAGISWHTAFLIYLIGFIILAGVLFTMKEPVRYIVKVEPGTPDETFPLAGIILVYATQFFGALLFFIMPIKFPYLMANLDAARILSENTALASGIFLGFLGCLISLAGLFFWRVAERFHRYTILTVSFIFFGIGLCGLGFSTSLVTVGISIFFIGIGDGLLVPTITNWIATITPKQFVGRAMGGYSIALNLGIFVSTLAIVPVTAIVATNNNLFIAFGCAAFVLTLPYLFVVVKRRFAPGS